MLTSGCRDAAFPIGYGARALVIGTFDSERHWRPPTLAELPSPLDSDAVRIVGAMDEVLFPLCGPGDTLLTRMPPSDSFKWYLDMLGLGINFRDLRGFGLGDDDKADGQAWRSDAPTCEILSSVARPRASAHCSGASVLRPYSVLQKTGAAAAVCGLQAVLPQCDAVRIVNSKGYSSRLRWRLVGDGSSMVIRDSDQLRRAGGELLKGSRIVVKDFYGVSGRGSLQVQSQRSLHSLVRYLKSQEDRGLSCAFVLEPLLSKAADFSCHFDVHIEGGWQLGGVQTTINSALGAYIGSAAPSPGLLRRLGGTGYFDTMEAIAAALHRDGYHGPVCVDSMLLKDGRIVPLVEINARFSMGRIAQTLTSRMALCGVSVNSLWCASVLGNRVSAFDDLMWLLAADGLLYRRGAEWGILPMASRTLPRALDEGGWCGERGTSRGRLYYAVVGTAEATARIHTVLARLLERLGLVMRPTHPHPASASRVSWDGTGCSASPARAPTQTGIATGGTRRSAAQGSRHW